MPSAELVAAVAQIKADGARRSPDDVLAQLQELPEWADISISQVRRAISAAPKVNAETMAARRKAQKAEHESKRVRTERTRPAEEQAQAGAASAFAAASKASLPCHFCDTMEATKNWAWHEKRPEGSIYSGRCKDDKLCRMHRAYTIAARAAEAVSSNTDYPHCPCIGRVRGYAPCNRWRLSETSVLGGSPQSDPWDVRTPV